MTKPLFAHSTAIRDGAYANVAAYAEVEIGGEVLRNVVVLTVSEAPGGDVWAVLHRERSWRVGEVIKYAVRSLRRGADGREPAVPAGLVEEAQNV